MENNSTYFDGGGDMRALMNGQGVGDDLIDQNNIELDFQNDIGQQLLSPPIHHRNDSMFSSSARGTPRHSISQHQAEAQPSANLHQNLHSPTGYSQLPVNNAMSRSASQYSSTSSGQRPHLHSQQRVSCGSFGNTLVAAGPAMSRSISSTSASQHTVPPQPYRLHSNPQGDYFQTRRSSNLSPNMGYEQFSATAMGPYNYAVHNNTDERMSGHENQDITFGQIGYGNENSTLMAAFVSSSHAPQESFGEHIPRQNQSRMTPPQHIAAADFSSHGSRSPTRSSPVSPPRSNRRRRHMSTSPSTRVDPVIGQVTLAGKFKCLKEICLNNGEDMTFNRHADFKRHFENTHAGRSIEFFCPEPGCPRSRRPEGGKKGRGFKGRKDKMNEHYKAVHHKESKKRKKVDEGDEYTGGRDYDDSAGAKPVKVRRRGDIS